MLNAHMSNDHNSPYFRQQTLNNNNTGTGGGGTGTGTGGGRSGGSAAWEEAWYAAELELRLRGALLDGAQWRRLVDDSGSWISRALQQQQHRSAATALPETMASDRTTTTCPLAYVPC